MKCTLDKSADDPSKKHWSRRALNSILRYVDAEEDAEQTASSSITDIIRRRARVTIGGIFGGKNDSEKRIIISDKNLNAATDKKKRQQKQRIMQDRDKVRANQFMGWWNRGGTKTQEKREHDDAPVKLPEAPRPEIPALRMAPSLIEKGCKLLC